MIPSSSSRCGASDAAGSLTTSSEGRTGAGMLRLVLPWLPVVASLLLSAHALRRDSWGLMGAWVIVAGLVCTRQAWARIVAGLALCLGVVVWADTAHQFILFRMMAGLPWVRLAMIMGVVICITGLASWSLLGRAGEVRYHRNGGCAIPQASAAVITFCLLVWTSHAAAKVTPLLADRFLPGSGMAQAALVAVYAAWATGRLIDPRVSRIWRPRLWALFSAVFFGQLLMGLVGLDIFLMTGRLHLPVPALILAGPLYRGDGMFMLGLFLFSVFLIGSAWCSHLCYIGAWDDVSARRVRKPGPLPVWAWKARLGIAVFVFGSAWGMGVAGVSPSVAFAAAAVFGLAGVWLMLAVSGRRGTLVHCTVFCPMGFMADLLGRLNPWRVKIDRALCTDCGACTAVCRYGALPRDKVLEGTPGFTCSRCRDCMGVCRHGAMDLTFAGRTMLGGKVPGRVRADVVFVVLAVSLHAVFLAVARM